MDRNTLFGFLAIGVILIVYFMINQPSAEQIADQKRIRDSLFSIEKIKQEEAFAIQQALNNRDNHPDSLTVTQTSVIDPVKKAEDQNRLYSVFAYNLSKKESKLITLENDKIKIK